MSRANTGINYAALAGVRPTQITYDQKIGGQWGDMGDEALISKFEYAEDVASGCGDADTAYSAYGRQTLMDHRPDPAFLAAEEQRRPETFARAGVLNLHYTGSRDGTSGLPVHRELFLGETDPDPRGIDPMPQWQELRRQQEARTRYVRLSADADNSITGGGWDPNAAPYAYF
jgi:hypothetical protein